MIYTGIYNINIQKSDIYYITDFIYILSRQTDRQIERERKKENVKN